MIIETEEDLRREKKAIETYVSLFRGSYQKLDKYDIDYKVFDKDGLLIAYAEVKGSFRQIYNAYPVQVAVKKLVKLLDKRLNPVIIWACDDGIIYGDLEKLVGTIKLGGRNIPRPEAVNDVELMAYFEKQKSLRYVRFI